MTILSGLNAWAIVFAAAVSFVFGGIWYGAFSKQWLAVSRLREDQLKSARGPSPAPFVIALAAQLVMAGMLDWLLFQLANPEMPTTAVSGAIVGFLAWFGFIMTALLVNHQFQMRPATLTAIDGGHWLGVMLIQGAILGALGFA